MENMTENVNSIEIMMEEHQNILRMCKVIRTICFGILKGKEINYDEFYEIIDFIKNYADTHHHGKEEKFLFAEMQEHLGRIGENLITHGMLVEHDYGRLYMSELKDALARVKEGDEESKLDVISNVISYTHHITRHIAKEDEVVYTYGAKHLSKEILDKVNKLSEKFEEDAKEAGVQEKYLDLLQRLEEKYKEK
ncbi:hemerythrin domain-containing protein [Clostridium sp. Marseille-P299]|uniref:hemerythrin domain-containing protein n=1 Tax=Clostridium sp. Marseille-P299 TaxID=1805477 RepID=UPI000B334127|nr:hemerythrin domain-containing protein [Clostridium sp. Marseille-P299]